MTYKKHAISTTLALSVLLLLTGCMTPEQIAAQQAQEQAQQAAAIAEFNQALERHCKEQGLKPKTKKYNECIADARQKVVQDASQQQYIETQGRLLRQADSANQQLMDPGLGGSMGSYFYNSRNMALSEAKENARKSGDSAGYQYLQQLQMQYQQQDLQRRQLTLQQQQMQMQQMRPTTSRSVHCKPDMMGGFRCD
jgi:hypothetical protein